MPDAPLAADEAAQEKQALIRRLTAITVGVVLVWLGCEVAATLGAYISPIRGALYNNHFYAFPLLSLCLLHVASGPSLGQMRAMLALAVVLTGVLYFAGQALDAAMAARDVNAAGTHLQWVVAMCQGVGLACLLELGWRAWRQRGARRTRALLYFLPGSLFIGFTLCGPYVMGLSTWVNPTTYDSRAYAADAAFGFQPSAAVASAFAAVPALQTVAIRIYNTNAMTIVFVYVMQLRQPRLPPIDIFSVIILAGTLAPPLYLLFPVSGPNGLLDEAFRTAPPPAAEVLARESRSPNGEASTAMPSLHTAVVLLCWWHARTLPRWCRLVIACWLLGTVLATLGLGLHFLVDLIVAVPYALVIQALAAPALALGAPARWRAAAVGAAFVAVWLLLIRFGLDVLNVTPLLPSLLAVVTVAVCFWQEHVLFVRTRARPEPGGAA